MFLAVELYARVLQWIGGVTLLIILTYVLDLGSFNQDERDICQKSAYSA